MIGGPPESANRHPFGISEPAILYRRSLQRFSMVLQHSGKTADRAIVSLAPLGVGGLTILRHISIFGRAGWLHQSLDRRTCHDADRRVRCHGIQTRLPWALGSRPLRCHYDFACTLPRAHSSLSEFHSSLRALAPRLQFPLPNLARRLSSPSGKRLSLERHLLAPGKDRHLLWASAMSHDGSAVIRDFCTGSFP